MKILLDMDEVLVDFIGGVCRWWDVKEEALLEHWEPGVWSCVEPLCKLLRVGYTAEHYEWFWDHIQGEESFWSGLAPLPWHSDILKLVQSVTDDWRIVTTPGPCPSSYSGKAKWLKNYFGRSFSRFHMSHSKYDLARSGVLLIDDKDGNVREFQANGGEGIIFPRHHNVMHRHKNNPVQFVAELLGKG